MFEYRIVRIDREDGNRGVVHLESLEDASMARIEIPDMDNFPGEIGWKFNLPMQLTDETECTLVGFDQPN